MAAAAAPAAAVKAPSPVATAMPAGPNAANAWPATPSFPDISLANAASLFCPTARALLSGPMSADILAMMSPKLKLNAIIYPRPVRIQGAGTASASRPRSAHRFSSPALC